MIFFYHGCMVSLKAIGNQKQTGIEEIAHMHACTPACAHTHTHTHTHTHLSKKFFIPHFSGMWRNGMETDASWTQMQKEIHQDWQLTLSTLIKWSRHSVISDTQKTAYSHISVDCTHHQRRQSSGEDVLFVWKLTLAVKIITINLVHQTRYKTSTVE